MEAQSTGKQKPTKGTEVEGLQGSFERQEMGNTASHAQEKTGTYRWVQQRDILRALANLENQN